MSLSVRGNWHRADRKPECFEGRISQGLSRYPLPSLKWQDYERVACRPREAATDAMRTRRGTRVILVAR
jgi:hypothetical protein